MKLPDYPVPGDEMRAPWGRQVIDYLRSLTPRSGMDIYPEANANGTTYRLASAIPGRKGSSEFPWDKLLFGYSIAGDVFTVKAGEVHFRDKIYTADETPLTIANDLTYVYVEMEWGTGISSIKQTTTKASATTSNSCFRKWLYLLDYTAPDSVSINTYGHTGGAISIQPVFG
jgi:hypothetical protein